MDERIYLDGNGLEKNEFRAYLRGFKMTVFDKDWDRKTCKSSIEQTSS